MIIEPQFLLIEGSEMRNFILILFFSMLTINVVAQNSGFTVTSTKVLPNPNGSDPGSNSNYSNLFTSYLEPANSGIYTNFAQVGAEIQNQENINDTRIEIIDNAAQIGVVSCWAEINPSAGGAINTNTVKFFTMYQDPVVQTGTNFNAQARVSFRILYELQNTSGFVKDLNYLIKFNIGYNFQGNVAAGQRYYNVALYQSDVNGTIGNNLYTTGQATANLQIRQNGTAYSNVPEGETRYIILEIWAYAASEDNTFNFFKVDGSSGISIGFDDEVIPLNDNLNNDPGIDNLAKMKFQLHNLLASDATGPEMGTTGAFAYNNMDWMNGTSLAYAVSENTDLLNSIDGITVDMTGFELFDFEDVDIVGQQEDERVYINGTANIYQDGDLKLQLENCRIGLNVSYPEPYGPGFSTTGGGWGEINAANSDDAWEAEFDENGTGQVDFVFNSMSSVINNPFYDAVISIVPTFVREKIVGFDIPDGGGVLNFLPEYYVSFNFTNASKSLIKGTQNLTAASNGMVRLIEGNPGGDLPVGIEVISPDRYWEFGTTASSFTANITFDLTGVGGVSNISNIRILHREDENSAWSILDPNTNTYSINGNQITVNGITSFSQFGIGSTSQNALPVELTSFSATQNENSVILNWSTATELNNYGFEIERKKLNSENWSVISFVQGYGNSNSVKNYSYVDDSIVKSDKYLYRIKQIDFDGKHEYSKIIEINFNEMLPGGYVLEQNYPNPFNPTTNIKFAVPENSNVKITIYNAVGKEVGVLVNGQYTAGYYNYSWDASNLASGVYFYEMITDNFRQVQKMMLMK
jgi:hypothetical protein